MDEAVRVQGIKQEANQSTYKGPGPLYVDEVSCGQKRSFQSVPKGSQEVDLLNRRGAP